MKNPRWRCVLRRGYCFTILPARYGVSILHELLPADSRVLPLPVRAELITTIPSPLFFGVGGFGFRRRFFGVFRREKPPVQPGGEKA